MDRLLSNEYIGLYFFSAVFQGNMALLALTGVFVIFRLQHIDSEIAETFQKMKRFLVNRSSGNGEEMESRLRDVHTSAQLMQKLKELASLEPKTVADGPIRGVAFEVDRRKELENLSSRSEKLLTLRGRTVEMMKSPFRLTGALCAGSIVALPAIHSIGTASQTAEMILIISTVIFQILALYKTSRFTLDIVSKGGFVSRGRDTGGW